jgi:hypothetical protein
MNESTVTSLDRPVKQVDESASETLARRGGTGKDEQRCSRIEKAPQRKNDFVMKLEAGADIPPNR